MKKIISSLLIMVVLFNFIFCNNTYAGDGLDTGVTEDEVTADTINNVLNGTSSLGKITFDILGAISGAIAGIIAIILNVFPGVVQLLMSIGCGETFTIEKTVFNEIPTFNIDYFNFEDKYSIGTNNPVEKSYSGINKNIIKGLKENVAKWYYILRLIAIIISLIMLIYVGIRMALSSVSSDKTKYKMMLMAWLESIVILFTLQYIISFIISLGQIFGNIFYDIREVVQTNGSVSFEEDIYDKMMSFMAIYAGWTYVMYSIAYWVLVFVQTKFFLSYFKRLFTVGFLILISPLVTIIYPIDKIGDGKGQSLMLWLSEFSINIFIQPIQALIYIVFMFTAGEIAKYSMIIALIFLIFLTKVEKNILQLFNLKNVVSLKPVEDERKK